MEELARIVENSKKVRVRGSGHSFNHIADSNETVVILDAIKEPVEIDSSRMIARVSAGLNYAEVASALESRGWALHNLASLPHISIAGAISTSSHGSGIKNGALHTAVNAVELIDAFGSKRTIDREDENFPGTVVGLGLTGIFTTIQLNIEPSYDIYQSVYANLSTELFLENLLEIMSGAYNISMFTTWNGFCDIWMKSRTFTPTEYFGIPALSAKVHPIPGVDPAACTDQGGSRGKWLDRLAHFRIDANPSAGNELQSEFFVESRHASSAFAALLEIAPKFKDKVLVSEIRTVAADDHWLSLAHNRESVAFHCTWKNHFEVPYLISLIEEVLSPYSFRPHHGKLFNTTFDYLETSYPMWNKFRDFFQQNDPEHKFLNRYTKSLFDIS